MRKLNKKYKRPRRPWDANRLAEEKIILKEYGLRRKRELWKASAILRDFRQRARILISAEEPEKKAALLERLQRVGLLPEGAGLDDVLALNAKNILERRLQTVVLRKGIATTPMQARQLITHGKILIDGRKTVYPSYMVTTEEEEKIIKVKENDRKEKPKPKAEKIQTGEDQTTSQAGEENETGEGEGSEETS
ncbi:MAG: 30S ribosomal protein S4 [Candidatus Aenigmatarchaeota archaeon]